MIFFKKRKYNLFAMNEFKNYLKKNAGKRDSTIYKVF